MHVLEGTIAKNDIAFWRWGCCMGMGNSSYELLHYPGRWRTKGLQREKPQRNLCLTSHVKAHMLMVGGHQTHSLASSEVTCRRMWAWKHLWISVSIFFSVSHSGLLKGVTSKLL